MKKSRLQPLILLGIFLLGMQPGWSATERVALVIDNSAYQDAPKKPTNDARYMATKLSQLGFKVDKHD